MNAAFFLHVVCPQENSVCAAVAAGVQHRAGAVWPVAGALPPPHGQHAGGAVAVVGAGAVLAAGVGRAGAQPRALPRRHAAPVARGEGAGHRGAGRRRRRRGARIRGGRAQPGCARAGALCRLPAAADGFAHPGHGGLHGRHTGRGPGDEGRGGAGVQGPRALDRSGVPRHPQQRRKIGCPAQGLGHRAHCARHPRLAHGSGGEGL